ncbi:MAG: RluA family pseudouridine synthase, partial [Clostridia bacterium]|nr:RluA family pseudouridine synthase [Clostridia bacterium]
MHELSVMISSGLAGRSVKSVALGQLKVSYGQLKRMKFSDHILVDGIPRHTDYILRAGECLRLCFPVETGPRVGAGSEKLNVVWEDPDILIIDKPAPLPSVASRQGGETLENRVFSYLDCPEDFIYRPVNRLDKGTSGLMMAAKNAHIQQRMQRMLHTDGFIREYLAVVDGRPGEEKGVIDLPIGHGPGIRRVIDAAGRPAFTEYEVLKAGERRSLLRLKLHTG